VRESKELERYTSTLELIRVMLRLLTVYYNQEELAPIVQQHLLPILDRFLQHLQSPLQQSPTSTQANIFCANIEIVAVLLESGGHFARRSNWTEAEGCLRAAVTNRLIDILDVVLGGALLEVLCLKSVKLLLLSLMHLTL
jgi:hypothetical protein